MFVLSNYSMKPCCLVLLFVLSLFYKPGYAQSDNTILARSVGALTKLTEAKPVEKVYLHLDKPYYAVGDTIWFKAYTVLGENHQLSTLSGVLYTELINEKDSIISRLTLPLNTGLAYADFIISGTYQPGNYRMRAYTNYMRNAGADYFFDQPIKIGVLKASALDMIKARQMSGGITIAKKDTLNENPDVHFFPEGGDLVSGLRSKVAIKITGKTGLGLDGQGTVIDNEGNEVAAFETQHLGMGVFALLPQAGKSYKAKITVANGSVYTEDLPKVLDEGFTLTVNDNSGDSILVKIAANNRLFTTRQKSSFYLIAQSAGKVYYTTQGKLESPVFVTRISKLRFPTGIMQFTLFSDSGEPLNERLVFIDNPDQLTLSAIPNKESYAPREKVTIRLNAKNKENGPAIGSFSSSVIDLSAIPTDEIAENSIFSNLLLTTDLKGYIEKPGYYFSNKSSKTKADLDILMLTQGYRRFEWKQIMSGIIPPDVYQPEKSIEISGYLKTLNGKPIAKGKVTLFTSTGGTFGLDTLSDDNGRFVFNNLIFNDSVKFIVQARDAKDRDNVKIELDSQEPGVVSKGKNIPDQFISKDASLSPYLQNNNRRQALPAMDKRTTILKEVKVTDKPITASKYSTNLNGAGHANQVLTSTDIEAAGGGNLLDILPGRLIGVNFYIDSRTLSLVPYSTRDMRHSMSIIVDGAFVDPSYLGGLNIYDIASIEVLRSANYLVLYGTRAGPGILLITTKRAGDNYNPRNSKVPGLVTYSPQGYYKVRAFYSPQYDGIKANTPSADPRSTIFWNPNIVTDKEGNASISFFNADGKGIYRVTIEGIDADGNLGRQVLKYKVE